MSFSAAATASWRRAVVSAASTAARLNSCCHAVSKRIRRPKIARSIRRQREDSFRTPAGAPRARPRARERGPAATGEPGSASAFR